MRKKIIAIIMIITVLIPNIALAKTQINEEPPVDLKFFAETLQYIEDNYAFETKENELLEAALSGMLQSLDPYSDYYTSEEVVELNESLSGSFVGIGVYIELKDGYTKVQSVMKGFSAEKAGLKNDDLIIQIDNVDIKDMELGEVSKLIKGPIDTTVNLKIKRNNSLLNLKVKRQQIKVKQVEYKILENNIGYIELKSFNGNPIEEMNQALKYFDNKKIEKIILDLRDNPGGYLDQAIEIARLFVPKGKAIVHIRGKNKALVTYASTVQNTKYELVVLINENSASASEILAGAIQDTKAGTLVGTKTFGKGIVQSLIPTANGGLIKLTTSEYLTPNKTSIHGKGIEANIKVENTHLDLQMEKAIELLK